VLTRNVAVIQVRFFYNFHEFNQVAVFIFYFLEFAGRAAAQLMNQHDRTLRHKSPLTANAH
jgi:hypothetical protein